MGKQKIERKAGRAWLLNADAAQGVVEAIVSVFGVLDDGDDIVAPGAYAKTIHENGDRVKVLDQHATDSVLRVVGVVMAMREVGRNQLPAEVLAKYPDASGGLWTQTQYLINTQEGKGVFDRIVAGAVNEYSIGYTTIKSEYRKETRPDGTTVSARILKEVRLWEYSPVIWGMNPATATVDVKRVPPDEENEEDTLPIDVLLERKARDVTLGGILQAEIVDACRYRRSGMLAREVITPEEFRLINDLLIDAAVMVYNALPDDLRSRIDGDDDGYMSAPVPATKAGRVLSSRNYTRIQEAHGALTAVMSDAGMMPDDDEKNATVGGDVARADADREDAKNGAEPGTVPLTLAIERDEIDLELELAMLGSNNE